MGSGPRLSGSVTGVLCVVQAGRVFVLSCQVLTLVLEEDGTVVDSEDFFQTVPSSAALMVLDKGEMWTRSKVSIRWLVID